MAVDHAFVRLKEFVDKLLGCHFTGLLFQRSAMKIRGGINNPDTGY